MVLTTRPLTAEEGEKFGLVTKVVPREDLEKWTLDYAQAIAVLPIGAIVVGKKHDSDEPGGKGKGTGTLGGWLGHAWSTNIKFCWHSFSVSISGQDKNQGKRKRVPV